jgi:AcrR family transcriptional regulator
MTIKTRGRPKSDPGRDLRADLLKTSRELLDEGGPGALSMREVARRAGCTHQAPYHYFADRETILATLVTEGFDELAGQLRSANEMAPAQGVRTALIASGQAYVAFAQARPGVFRIMFRPDACNLARFPAAMQAGARARAELDRLNEIVGGTRSTPVLTTILWAHVHGLACLLMDGPLATPFENERQRVAHLHCVVEAFADQVLASKKVAPDICG